MSQNTRCPQVKLSAESGERRDIRHHSKWATSLLEVFLIVLFVRSFLFEAFNIPSGSMEPTLLIGDHLFVSKFSYGFSRYSLPLSPPIFSGRILAAQPARGDIAVFRHGPDDFIKRVIGLPGERIQLVGGVILIN